MSVIATIRIPGDEFKFGSTLDRHSELAIEFERVIPAGNECAPYLWITAPEELELREMFVREPDVTSVNILENRASETLVRVAWTDNPGLFLEAVSGENGTILSASARDNEWTVVLRFRSRQALGRCYQNCRENDMDLTVHRIQDHKTATSNHTLSRLSEPQFETLQSALDAGYFAVPREITLEELAAESNISDSALSQRLRRGIRNILTETFPDKGDSAHKYLHDRR